MTSENKRAAKNTIMLYLMNIAKMVFPLVTLPYLTRVLTVDTYGVVSYVKAVMQYMQLVMMFGFLLSATKDIVNAQNDKKRIGEITGDVLLAKLILGFFSAIVLGGLTFSIPILRDNILYTVIAFINVIVMEMMADFLFRGIDKMEVITIRFVIAKTISTLLTFVFIKGDMDILLIPIFDLMGSVVALVLVIFEIKKMSIPVRVTSVKSALIKLKESAVYFISDMATTAFGALNTLLIGIFVNTQQVAFWSIAMQLVAAVQSLYTPITNGIYPTMIRTKSRKFIQKTTMIFMPVVVIGCIFCFVFSKYILLIVGGKQYVEAESVFRALIPVMFFSFPSILYGWPTLGPIGKQMQTTMTTIITAVVQVVGLIVFILLGQFTLINVALLRGGTEFLLFILRFLIYKKYENEYSD